MSAEATMAHASRSGRIRAAWWESRVWLAADPAFFGLLRLTGRFPVVRLGRLGVLVNDARVGREILLDDARFRSVGPGTHGELINEVMGPRGLLNMDGADHASLRRMLADLFAAGPARRLADETAAGPIAEASARLAAGEEVDVARLIRIITGRTAYALLGAPDPPDGDEGYLRVYHVGEELLAMTADAARHGIRPDRKPRAEALIAELASGARAGWDSLGIGPVAPARHGARVRGGDGARRDHHPRGKRRRHPSRLRPGAPAAGQPPRHRPPPISSHRHRSTSPATTYQPPPQAPTIASASHRAAAPGLRTDASVPPGSAVAAPSKRAPCRRLGFLAAPAIMSLFGVGSLETVG